MTVEPQPLRRGKKAIMLIYGPHGSTKTRTIGSMPGTLIIRPPTDHTDSIDDPTGIEEIVLRDWTEQLEVWEWGQQGGFAKYKWVWLDGLTLFEEIGLDDVFQDAIDRKPERAKFGADVGEYGINRGRLGKWIRDMVSLAKAGHFNFGMTALPMEWWDPQRQKDVLIPQVGSVKNGNLSVKICGYTNIVAYMDTKELEDKPDQHILTVDGPGIYGKDQLHCFPALKSGRHGFVDPDMKTITAAIDKARRTRGGSKTGSSRRAAAKPRPAARRRRRKSS